jgi:hypothetical protein
MTAVVPNMLNMSTSTTHAPTIMVHACAGGRCAVRRAGRRIPRLDVSVH